MDYFSNKRDPLVKRTMADIRNYLNEDPGTKQRMEKVMIKRKPKINERKITPSHSYRRKQSRRVILPESMRKLAEKEKVNLDTVTNLADQINQFLTKNSASMNLNGAVNTLAMGLFAGVSNFYNNDDDESTIGSAILDKIITKTKAMLKDYPELDEIADVQDFDLSDGDEEEQDESESESEEDETDVGDSEEEDESEDEDESDEGDDDEEEDESDESDESDEDEDEVELSESYFGAPVDEYVNHPKVKMIKESKFIRGEGYLLSLTPKEIDSLGYIADRYQYAESIYDSIEWSSQNRVSEDEMINPKPNKQYLWAVPEHAAWDFMELVNMEDGIMPLAGGNLLNQLNILYDSIV
jgi:hypothetical protein